MGKELRWGKAFLLDQCRSLPIQASGKSTDIKNLHIWETGFVLILQRGISLSSLLAAVGPFPAFNTH